MLPGGLVTDVLARLSESRAAHVAAVVETAGNIARAGGWPGEFEARVVRAAWYHDALKDATDADRRAQIVAGGEQPDPWAATFAPDLLHAQAAAVWAAERGERDAELLAAVRYHPTGHPDWSDLGAMLFVADFTEPTRAHGETIDLALLRERAAGGPADLKRAACEILAMRLRHLLASGRRVHPRGIETWNVWTKETSRG